MVLKASSYALGNETHFVFLTGGVIRKLEKIGWGQIVKKASLVTQWYNPPFSAEDPGLIPGSGRSPGEATHSSILAWELPWTEELGRLHTVHGVTKELVMT